MILRISALVVAACTLVVSGVGSASSGGGSQIIVIGDSVAAGFGVQPDESWPAILAARTGSDLADLAISGSNSHSVIERIFDWPSGRSQSQLSEAGALLTEATPGSVAAVALGIGVNDWAWVRDPATGKVCAWDPVPACEALFIGAMDSLDDNLHLILTELRAAMEPSTPLLVMTYYDIVSFHAIETINGVILGELVEHDAIHVDAQAYFAGREQELIADRVHPSPAGHVVLADIFSNALPPDTDGDGLSEIMEAVLGADPTVQDTDGDGCSDGQEFGSTAAFGGRRDPLNPWDFYDVAGPGGGPPDGVIDLANDILGVLLHVRAYDSSFDRGPSVGPNPWNTTAPDGRIDLSDILGIVYQFRHDCR